MEKGGYEKNAETLQKTEVTGNIDEIFDYALELSTNAYDIESAFDVDTYFIEGEFPILINKAGSTLFIVFRGTQNNFSSFSSSMESISNMIYDLSTWNGSGKNQNMSDYENLKKVLTGESASIKAHSGFLQVLDKYYAELRDEIDKYSASVDDIIFSGHSAGGAMCSLAYYVYQNDINTKNKIKVNYAISFGSPRVFINNFNNITRFNESCPNYYRVFNKDDIVSYLPFHKPILGLEMNVADGFIHVGKPICLDGNVEKNSLNNLILEVLKGNKGAFESIFEKYTMEEIKENKLIEFITSDEYLSLMAGSLFTCYSGKAINPDLTDDMIYEYGKRLQGESSKLLTYALKCGLVKPFLLDDILLKNKVAGDDEDKQDITISGITASIMGFNKVAVKAHDLKFYKENLDARVQREVETDIPFLEPIMEKGGKKMEKSFPSVEKSGKEMEKPQPITIEDKIQEAIDKGEIMGITYGNINSLIIVK